MDVSMYTVFMPLCYAMYWFISRSNVSVEAAVSRRLHRFVRHYLRIGKAPAGLGDGSSNLGRGFNPLADDLFSV